ncbi:MAG TPA: aspartate aminotransferase family protein [Solirubrobacteraceae bacterium]|nr:aspartate aminotransferase family protein [Solirubrobacteraceae bacterium]
MSTDTRLWHPFADMHAVRGDELVIARGEGVHVWDEDGNRYLDGTASLWCVNVGHGRAEIADAAARQLRTLASYSAFGAFANRPALELAERLCALAPQDDARVFLGSGGGDAIDTAAKLARRYFAAVGQPDRVHLIGRSQGYHGTHGLGTSVGGIAANREGMGPLDPHTSQVPHDSLEALEAEFERVGAQRVAAVFVEPVMGAGGVHQPRPGYVEGVAALCERAGALLVLDVVIAAFGRLGSWFAADRFGVRPDLLCFAKGVTSGYLPLGGVLASGRVAEPFWERGGTLFRHGPTYSAHPTCCAAAMANLDILEREELLVRGRELEDEIAAALRPLAGHDLAGEVRAGIGALGAVTIEPDALRERPDLPARVFAHARDRGVLVRPLGDAVAISPPLVITREQVGEAAAAIGDALDAAVRDRAQPAGDVAASRP